MANSYFNFKQFSINQGKSAFKVGTDGVLLGAYADISNAGRILDVGTGTSLIALMLAQRSDAEIVAIEPDHDSFIQSCENINRSKWSKRIRVEETAFQDFSDSLKFDLIITNPPYFSDSVRNPDLRKAAARHDFMLNSDDILKNSCRLLSENGRLQLIMPYAEGNIFIAEAGDYGLFCNDILKIRPLPTSDIRRLIITFSRKKVKPAERFLTIEYGKRHDFTEDFKTLTKDFYLKF